MKEKDKKHLRNIFLFSISEFFIIFAAAYLGVIVAFKSGGASYTPWDLLLICFFVFGGVGLKYSLSMNGDKE